jgi:hypothetical protein
MVYLSYNVEGVSLMESAILFAILNLLVESSVSGMTYDMLKATGSAIKSFAQRFTKKKYFRDEQQAEAYLEKIGHSEPYNKANPTLDACNIYTGMTGKAANEDFKHELEAWIVENKDELFKKPGAVVGSNVARVTTGNINATGASNVTINVNQAK